MKWRTVKGEWKQLDNGFTIPPSGLSWPWWHGCIFYLTKIQKYPRKKPNNGQNVTQKRHFVTNNSKFSRIFPPSSPNRVKVRIYSDAWWWSWPVPAQCPGLRWRSRPGVGWCALRPAGGGAGQGGAGDSAALTSPQVRTWVRSQSTSPAQSISMSSGRIYFYNTQGSIF